MVARGEVCWVDFGAAVDSAPALRRPAVVISSDRFNRSRIGTVIVAAITSSQRLAAAPGNVALVRGTAGLRKSSVVNVSALFTLDRTKVNDPVGALPAELMAEVDRGLRLALGV